MLCTAIVPLLLYNDLFVPFCAPALFLLHRTAFRLHHRLQRFFYQKNSLRFASVYIAAAAANLSLLLGRYDPWAVGIALGACALDFGLLIYVLDRSGQSAQLLEYQRQTQLLEQQYNRQLRHYQSFQRQIEQVQSFRHDLRPLMIALGALIRAGDYEKALRTMDDICEAMPQQEKHPKYSSNVILDALLQDISQVCRAQQIRFSAHISIPQHTGLSTLDSVRIFSNVINNALQACLKIPRPERFIEIFCYHEPHWIMFEAVNSYDGHLLEENGKLLTTKADKLGHGLGMRILTEITENLGGFVLYQTNAEQKTFLIRVHIPRPAHQNQRDLLQSS